MHSVSVGPLRVGGASVLGGGFLARELRLHQVQHVAELHHLANGKLVLDLPCEALVPYDNASHWRLILANGDRAVGARGNGNRWGPGGDHWDALDGARRAGDGLARSGVAVRVPVELLGLLSLLRFDL